MCFILYFSKLGIPPFSHVAQNRWPAWPSKARECQQQGGVHSQDNGLFKPQQAAQGHMVCMGRSLLHTHKSSHSSRPVTVTSLLPESLGLMQAANLASHPIEGRKPNQTPGVKKKAKCEAEAISEAGTRCGNYTWFTTGPASVPANILGASGSKTHSGQMVTSGGHHSHSTSFPNTEL